VTEAKALAIRQTVGVEKLGEIMYKSGFFQDTQSQAQAIVKILAGAELDFGPVASMNGIFIINGKTTLAANLVAAAIKRSGRYDYRINKLDNTECSLEFFEIVGGKRDALGTSSFSMKDAADAKLASTTNWQKFPRNMLFSRAMTNGARWYTPDVFNGPVYSPEEMGADVNEEGAPVYEPPEPPAEPSTPTRERNAQDTTVSSADDRLWKRWEARRSEAFKYGIVPPNLQLPIGRNQLVSQGAMLNAKIEAKQAQLDREESERAQARQAAADDNPEADHWATNRALMAEAYAAGLKLHDLPSDATPEQVRDYNREIAQQLVAGGDPDARPTH